MARGNNPCISLESEVHDNRPLSKGYLKRNGIEKIKPLTQEGGGFFNLENGGQQNAASVRNTVLKESSRLIFAVKPAFLIGKEGQNAEKWDARVGLNHNRTGGLDR